MPPDPLPTNLSYTLREALILKNNDLRDDQDTVQRRAR